MDQFIRLVSSNNKFASIIATVTTGAGVGEWLNFIPDDIGKLASVAGIGLSISLIWTHLWRTRMEHERFKLEMEERRRAMDRIASAEEEAEG